MRSAQAFLQEAVLQAFCSPVEGNWSFSPDTSGSCSAAGRQAGTAGRDGEGVEAGARPQHCTVARVALEKQSSQPHHPPGGAPSHG